MFFGTEYPIFGKFLLLRNLGRRSWISRPKVVKVYLQTAEDRDWSNRKHATDSKYTRSFR